jgi:aspartate 1-decarboxylase
MLSTKKDIFRWSIVSILNDKETIFVKTYSIRYEKNKIPILLSDATARRQQPDTFCAKQKREG